MTKKKRKAKDLKKKVNNLKQIIFTLKQKGLISTEGVTSLEKSITDVPSSIIRRYIINSRREKPSRKKYPPELRSFALTLHFYSPKGYDFVRKTFALSLPAPAVIRSWYYNIDCRPGYCMPAFQLIEKLVKSFRFPIFWSVFLDEMSIKKKIEMIGSEIYGYIDMGFKIDDDSLSEASNALVFMAVGINGNWKIPIAYFLINSLTGIEKANIANECVRKLTEVGVVVVSITCDGPASHFTMMKELGCDILNVEDLKPWFTHPSKPNDEVFFLLDACHMLKLIRNHLHSLKIIKNSKGEEICWEYIELLCQIQDQQQLTFGTKLGRRHIEWENQKMKVSTLTIIAHVKCTGRICHYVIMQAVTYKCTWCHQ